GRAPPRRRRLSVKSPRLPTRNTTPPQPTELARMPAAKRLTLPLLLLSLAPLGADWPQWRGPGRSAVSPEKGLLKEWPKDGPPLLWTASGLGSGYSSVVLAGERIYTMGDRGGKEYLLALDRADGKKVWEAPVGAVWRDGGPRCTPTADGERVYAL